MKQTNGKNDRNGVAIHIIFCTILLFFICFATTVGAASISLEEIINILASKLPVIGDSIDLSAVKATSQVIIWKVRLPRVLLSAMTGGTLAVVGATFQGVFRNQLADPHILGVSSGAALGATIAMLTGINITVFGLGVIGIFAFVGAMVSVAIVYGFSRYCARNSVTSMLLIGTAIGTLFSSMVSLLMTFNEDEIEKVYMWTLGSFTSANWDKVRFLAVFLVVGYLILFLYAQKLNVIITGEETAKTLGIDTRKVIKILVVTSSLLVAASVSVSGIIGFVGLIIPHIVRLLSGSNCKKLIPYSFYSGAIFLMLCDTIARTIANPVEVPVGIVTAVIGAPYFIAILFFRQRKRV